MNKQGSSLSGWTGGILFVIMFMGILTSIVIQMNVDYGQDYTTGLGVNESRQAFADTTKSSVDEIKGGEAEFISDQGLTLSSSWGIIKSLLSVIWGFITGSFITTAFGYMMLPAEVGLIMRLLYTVTLVFIVLKILFRVKA